MKTINLNKEKIKVENLDWNQHTTYATVINGKQHWIRIWKCDVCDLNYCTVSFYSNFSGIKPLETPSIEIKNDSELDYSFFKNFNKILKAQKFLFNWIDVLN